MMCGGCAARNGGNSLSEQDYGREPDQDARKEPSRRHAHRRKSRRATVGRVLGTILLIMVVTGAITACFAAVYISSVIMPQAKLTLQDFSMSRSTTIYYTDPDSGEAKELRTVHGDENRVPVSYDQIPENLVHAAIAIEDKRFIEHHGVDWKRTAGAFLNMFLNMQDTYGGSTITQQLIKNLTKQNDITVKRKVLEIFRALELERNYSKEDIMEYYLNYIYLGEGCNGVSTAAQTYFGKSVSDLDLAECASLIGITNNPSMYNPYLSAATRANNKTRQEIILDAMCKQGYITQEQCDAAKAEKLVFQRGEDEGRQYEVYSWYEDKLIEDVISDLQTTFDWSYEYAKQMFYSGGLKVYACIDVNAQSVVDDIYNDTESLPYTSASGQQLQSAIVLIDNTTGEVKAISGGIGTKTVNLGFSRATDAERPSGSSIKPLSTYGPAIDMGLITPATVIDDSPYSYDGKGGSPWPVNASGTYKGLTTVYEGLQNSINTVAVKIMANYISPQIAYDYLTQRLHLTTLVDSMEVNGQVKTDIGLAQLALGGQTKGVSPYEMAAAFSVFPRDGTYIAPRTYTKVLDSDGNVLLDNSEQSSVAFKDTTAWYINYMLKNAVANGTGKNANFSGMTVAGKTGTTTSRKDLWFVGYTPYYTAAVWTGYDQQERLSSSLGNPATTMWRKVMSRLHEGLADKDFDEPSSAELVTVSYCKDSGMRPSQYCYDDIRGDRITTGVFVKGTEPTEECTIHKPVNVCTSAPILDSSGQPTGLYHLAGDLCPDSDLRTISVVDYTRTGAAAAVTTRDHMYMKSYLEEQGVYNPPNTEPSGTKTIDPDNPNTWPGLEDFESPDAYAKFDPNDPTTYPDGYKQQPDTTQEPDDSASPEPSDQPEPTASATPTPDEPLVTPDDQQDYVPVGQ